MTHRNYDENHENHTNQQQKKSSWKVILNYVEDLR